MRVVSSRAVLVFADPYHDLGLAIVRITDIEAKEVNVNAVFKPFSIDLWMFLMFFYVPVTWLLFWLFERLNNEELGADDVVVFGDEEDTFGDEEDTTPAWKRHSNAAFNSLYWVIAVSLRLIVAGPCPHLLRSHARCSLRAHRFML